MDLLIHPGPNNLARIANALRGVIKFMQDSSRMIA